MSSSIAESKNISAIIKEYKLTGNNSLKETIVKEYLWLVKKIAKKFSDSFHICIDDLIQVGCIGLINALNKFDVKYNSSFKTYASHLINGEIKHYIRDNCNIIKIPRDIQEIQPKISQAKNFLSLNNKELSVENISEYTNIPKEKVREALEIESIMHPISLNQENGDENLNEYINNIEDKKYSSFQLSQEDRILLQSAMNKIKEQSQQILYYAFYEDLTQTEIAKKLGISQMQVSRKIKSAISELWEILNVRITPW
jgi:RNA polymerase sigma-B factor